MLEEIEIDTWWSLSVFPTEGVCIGELVAAVIQSFIAARQEVGHPIKVSGSRRPPFREPWLHLPKFR